MRKNVVDQQSEFLLIAKKYTLHKKTTEIVVSETFEGRLFGDRTELSLLDKRLIKNNLLTLFVDGQEDFSFVKTFFSNNP